MTGPSPIPLAALEALDARIDDSASAGMSLNPRGGRATRLAELVPSLVPLTESVEVTDALAEAAMTIAGAQLEAFPSNLFWDFDALLASVLRQARQHEDVPKALLTAAAGLGELLRLFGIGTPIRFRYVHDFMYGFDWAAWVRRDPSNRVSTGPFDADYVSRTMERGHELLRLIEADDDEYPQLAPGVYRNPFGFRRSLEDELRLFRDLSERDLVPVRGWSAQDAPRWREAFGERRAERAQILGIAHASVKAASS